MRKIDCFIAFCGEEDTRKVVAEWQNKKLVNKIFIVSNQPVNIEGVENLVTENPHSTASMKQIGVNSKSEFCLIALQKTKLEIGQFSLERLLQVAENTGASLVYSDYIEVKNGEQSLHPVIDYQRGSLRDDFNFGPVLFYRTDTIKGFSEDHFNFAGFYALRLYASRNGDFVRIPEFLFTMNETDTRKSGEKQFDYVSGNENEKQMEMEKACTTHLKKIDGLLQAPFKKIDFSEQSFPVEASVIIPVWNRLKTIKDAIDSVLSQKTNFSFNLIVIDNYSSDGTTEILADYASNNEKLIHVIPYRKDLGIGGCWNEGIFHEKCGKFAVQLDSDDLYSTENTLQIIVDKFYEEKCAMVIGSYQMTNFDLEEIPPGIIDHNEWTPENGPNNALRINGLGAPRAFYTPVLRNIRVPNVSYGEDYAVGLAISREYKIGRIYDPIYLCRRWDENSDASLDIQKQNTHNTYKDRIRTIELKARIRKVRREK